MKNKILITRPYSTQIKPVLDEIKKDSFFRENENYVVYNKSVSELRKNPMSEDELDSYKIIVCDINPKFIMNKPYIKTVRNEKQIMIQLTHGVWIKQLNSYLHKGNGIDYILSPNKYSDNLYKELGYLDEEILSFGFPRMEYYKNLNKNEILAKLFETFDIKKRYKRFVLFAPSWINVKDKNNKRVEYSINPILSKLKRDTLLIISPHFLTKAYGVEVEYIFKKRYKNSFIINELNDNSRLTGQELMLICDKIFTDYSSIIYDFAALKGIENSNFYFPIKDNKNQSKRTRKIYFDQYSNWGENIHFDIGTSKFWEEMDFYNKDNPNLSTKLLVNHLKKILKENDF